MPTTFEKEKKKNISTSFRNVTFPFQRRKPSNQLPRTFHREMASWDKDMLFVCELMGETLKTLCKVCLVQYLGKISRLNTACGLIIKKWKEKIHPRKIKHCHVIWKSVFVSFDDWSSNVDNIFKKGGTLNYLNTNIHAMIKNTYWEACKIRTWLKRLSDFLWFRDMNN